MIEVDNLHKSFGAFEAVKGVSFRLQPGEVLGFIGPNGAGKSTTMKMMAGFLAPTLGTVSMFGQDVWAEPLAAKAAIGYLPEGAPAYGDMRTLAFLKFIAAVRGIPKSRRAAAVDAMVAALELEKLLSKRIEQLSKGFKRRVALAQALIHDPRVLILDEPTDGLDPNQKHQVRRLIQNLSDDKIVIISTHILEEVSALCSRVIVIAGGQLVADATPAELAARSVYHGAVRVRCADPRVPTARLAQLPGVERVEWDAAGEFLVVVPTPGKTLLGEVKQCLDQAGIQAEEMYVEQGHLDDVFRSLTHTDSVEAA